MALTRSDTLTSHWWLRPGWSETAENIAWHLVFDDQRPLHEVVARYQQSLAAIEGIDLVPRRWLHLTIQAIGFAHELRTGDVHAVLFEARNRLADVREFDLTFGLAEVHREGVTLTASPIASVTAVQTALRAGVPVMRHPWTGRRRPRILPRHND